VFLRVLMEFNPNYRIDFSFLSAAAD
jgi:hypothetical protein